MYFTILRTVFRNCHQYLFSMCSQDCEFHQISRVEEDICILLIRIDPFDFRTTDIRPMHD